MNMLPIDRIMRHVKKHDGSGHWEWVGRCTTGKSGEYGGARLFGRMMSSHRAVWILTKGFVPKDLLHQCGMTRCCNPDHLKEGTHRENIMQAIKEKGGVWGAASGEGDERKSRKLKLADEAVIAARVAGGESQRSLAKEYGVTQACISLMLKRLRSK